MTATLRPETVEQVTEVVQSAIIEGRQLELTGAGSKRALGRPCGSEDRLDLSALAGIVLYEPEELVLTARPGTPLAEIESVLAERRQHLAFEPGDIGALLDGDGRPRSNIRVRWVAPWRATWRGRGVSRPARRATTCWAFTR